MATKLIDAKLKGLKAPEKGQAEASWECLALPVTRKLRIDDVLAALAELFVLRGPPAHLRSDHSVTCSMSRFWKVWDNAAMESFYSSLKIERIGKKVYCTRAQAKADVFDYIECLYKPTRLQLKLGCLSPIDFE